jgi:hypothetical protein
MSDDDYQDGQVHRRAILKCMTWAGTGVLWTVTGGIPRSLGLVDAATAAETTDADTKDAETKGAEAKAAEPKATEVKNGLTFLQISDSHIGFDKPANPNPLVTLQEAVAKIKALSDKPSFMLHTGDITHLSKPDEFDAADGAIAAASLEVHYVPGEHDVLDEGVKLYRARYGKRTKGAGWYSFDASGVHFVGLVNVVDLRPGGLGNLGNAQLKWLKDDLKGRTDSTPIVVFTHQPLWMVYPQWGWGTQDGAQALGLLKRFGSVTVLNGHIHQLMQKIEGNVCFHTAMSTAFPLAAPGSTPALGALKVPDDKLRSVLGISEVNYLQGQERLAIVDKPLMG